MKRMFVAFLLAALSGCATYVDFKREQPPLYRVQAERAGIALLHVAVDDEVLAKAPNDFSNMTGLIAKAAKDYAELRGGFAFVNNTDLGFTPKWIRADDGRRNEPSYRLAPLEGIPAGVQTPLVMVVKVLDWRTFTETTQKEATDAARVKLQISTWTREGKEVETEVIDALARAGDRQVHLKSGDSDLTQHHRVTWYQRSDGRDLFEHQPKERDALFMNVLRDAVALHLYPYFPHQVLERHVLADDAPLKPGVEAAQSGRYDEAIQKWEAVTQSDPKAHGALYNAGILWMVKGDDAKAHELLSRAAAVEDKFLYRSMRDVVRDRLAMRKEISPAGIQATVPAS